MLVPKAFPAQPLGVTASLERGGVPDPIDPLLENLYEEVTR
jgi:hypothetical protein